MGAYINPKNESKEAFLEREAISRSLIPPKEFSKEPMIVCLIDNMVFTAAGICFNEREFEDFKFDDGRPRVWYLVPLEKLRPVSDIDIYLK